MTHQPSPTSLTCAPRTSMSPCLAKLSRTRSNARDCSLIVFYSSSVLRRDTARPPAVLGTASRCPERVSIHELPRGDLLGNSAYPGPIGLPRGRLSDCVYTRP